MPSPTTPQTPSPKSPQSERDRQEKDQQAQSSKPGPGQDRNKTGRPQDDRDPTSPSRGTARPIDPNATNKANEDAVDNTDFAGNAVEDDSMETGASRPDDKSRTKPF